MVKIVEYRVILPFKLPEYKVGQLFSTAEMSRQNTGGSEGVQVLNNQPFSTPPEVPLLDNRSDGQYTYKIYHLKHRVPLFVRACAPKGSLELHEEAWNAFPYCRTVLKNPGYMKESFYLKIETMHLADRGDTQNAHKLPPDVLKQRDVVIIDIANDSIRSKDYKREEDPKLFKSLTKPDLYGPLGPNWRFERRLFFLFHRLVYCSLDKWIDLNMDEIRALEDKTKEELDESREKGEHKGLKD